MSARIYPSLLAADFVNIERDLGRIDSADGVHVDIMDYHFVPNLTFGVQTVERINEVSALPLDVHLMIDNPERFAPDYVRAGAQSITFHAEATDDPVALARRIRSLGAEAAVALKPGTSSTAILDAIEEFDMILVMTVEPGFGGQQFMTAMVPKILEISQAVKRAGSSTRVQVDGGIAEATIHQAASAGADTFVAGSSIFGSDDPAAQIISLRDAANRALVSS